MLDDFLAARNQPIASLIYPVEERPGEVNLRGEWTGAGFIRSKNALDRDDNFSAVAFVCR